MAFGYRIFQVQIAKRMKPDVVFQFDNVALHPSTALGLLREALTSRIDQSATDEDRQSYFTVDAAYEGGWVLAVDAGGGQFGRARRVRDVETNTDRPPIGANDAVLDDLPVVLVIPNHGDKGIMVAATSGRSHNAFSLRRALEVYLGGKGFSLKLASDLADRTAWSTYLGQTDLDVTHVELIQSQLSSSRKTFGTKGRVSRARVMLTLADQATKRNVLDQVKARVFQGTSLSLAPVVGMDLKDSDFDDYRIVYVQDGREKRLSISNDFPHFIYPLEDLKSSPTSSELLDAAMSDVEYLMGQMGIQYPTSWKPDRLKKL